MKRGTRRASSRSRTMFEAYLLVTQRFSLCGGALRDDTKNGFVADFRKFYPMNLLDLYWGWLIFRAHFPRNRGWSTQGDLVSLTLVLLIDVNRYKHGDREFLSLHDLIFVSRL